MPGLQQEFTEQETKQLIADAMSKGDTFRIRVQRKLPGGGAPVIASFDEATADHVTFAERWLPELAGGGQFILTTFHATESLKQLGGSINLTIDNLPARSVNLDVAESQSWSGPRAISYPKRQPKQPNANGMHVDGREIQDIAVGPQGSSQTPLQRAPLTSSDPLVAAQERAQRAEEQIKEERFRNQIETIRRASEESVKVAQAQVNALMAELKEQRAAASRPQPPAESSMDMIAKLGALLVPLVQTMITANNETKLKMLEMEARNAERSLEAARLQAEQLNKILTASLEKKGIDPIVQLMFDQLKDVKKSENPMTAMQGALQLITAANDAGLTGQREGGGAGDVAIEVARALGAGFEAFMASKGGGAGQQQIEIPGQRLPAAQRTVQPGQQGQPPAKKPTAMQYLDRLIKQHHNPDQTATFFLEMLGRDPEIRKRFADAGQDLEVFFKTYWAQWAMQNISSHGPYVQSLNEAVLRVAQARGMLRQQAQQAAEQPAATAPAAQPQPQQPRPATPIRAVPEPEPIEQAEPIDPGGAHDDVSAQTEEDDFEEEELAEEEAASINGR